MRVLAFSLLVSAAPSPVAAAVSNMDRCALWNRCKPIRATVLVTTTIPTVAGPPQGDLRRHDP